MMNNTHQKIPDREPTLEEWAHSRLLSYVAYQFNNYIIGEMHRLIAAYLEAVERGDITRLLIFAPPRHGKTALVGEYFPAWYLGRNPSSHIIYTTYNQEKGNDIGRRVRNQVISDNFKRIFPGCTPLKDSKSISHLSTEQHGEYFNVGMGSAIVGRGADLMVIDDPLKDRKEAESKLARTNMKNWYRAVAYTRLMPGGKIIVINTRWHSQDLSGYLLSDHSHENWTLLDLKAIAEPGDILERKEGEALWPEFRDTTQLNVIKETLGSREWNAQFQQRPTAEGGGSVQYEWLKYYDNLPKPEDVQRIIVSWDTAYKPDQIHDPTAATVWQITHNGYYLIDVVNKRLIFPDLVKEVKRVHELYHPSSHLIEGRATGQSLIQQLQLSTTIPVIEISTKNTNNEIRFDAITTLFEAGKVWFPKQAHWLSETEDQICSFPTAPHDDIADSVSQFLNWVNKPRYVRRPPSKLYWK
ncbi:MAG: phage terminase large subunit [Gammaproteobacteria bacterium]|nr:phage terminase large subunit [Gammaproteobacteria bacterium]